MSRALELVRQQTGVGGSVYLIDADHGVKVGVTRWPYPQERVLDISRTAGIDLRVFRAWQFPSYELAGRVEMAAHRALAADRMIGEWFHCHPLEACNVIDNIIRAIAAERAAA